MLRTAGVLDGGGDDVVPIGVGAKARTVPRIRRLNVGLGATAPKKDDFLDDIFGGRADQRGDAAPGEFQTLFRKLSEMVNTGGVAIHFGQRLSKMIEDLRRDRRGRVMVEVEMMHHISV